MIMSSINCLDLIQLICFHLSANPVGTVLIILFTFVLYKIYYFTEIIVEFKDDVPNDVRILPDQKLPPYYPNGWIPIFESALIKKNQVKSVCCFGQELVAIRGSNGQVYVIDAYCPHLGANFSVGGVVHRNNCNEECIRCPFHGWSFRVSDGICSNVPYENGPTPNAKIKVWPSLEINNVIFVWYHADNDDPSWYPQEIDQILSKQWTLRGRTEHFVNCHFQEIPENGADVAHLGEIHNSSFILGSDLNLINKLKSYDKILEHEWHAQWNACSPPQIHMSTIDIVNRNKLFGRNLFEVNLTVNQVGPAYVELKFETNFLGGIKGILLQMVKPISPMRNSIIHNIYTENTIAGYIFGKFLIFAEAKMLERDIRIWNRKAFLSKPYIAKSEKSILKYRRWFNQFYSESSKRSLDW